MRLLNIFLDDLTEESYNDIYCMKNLRLLNPNEKIQEFCNNRITEIEEAIEKERMIYRRIRRNILT